MGNGKSERTVRCFLVLGVTLEIVGVGFATRDRERRTGREKRLRQRRSSRER